MQYVKLFRNCLIPLQNAVGSLQNYTYNNQEEDHAK